MCRSPATVETSILRLTWGQRIGPPMCVLLSPKPYWDQRRRWRAMAIIIMHSPSGPPRCRRGQGSHPNTKALSPTQQPWDPAWAQPTSPPWSRRNRRRCHGQGARVCSTPPDCSPRAPAPWAPGDTVLPGSRLLRTAPGTRRQARAMALTIPLWQHHREVSWSLSRPGMGPHPRSSRAERDGFTVTESA